MNVLNPQTLTMREGGCAGNPSPIQDMYLYYCIVTRPVSVICILFLLVDWYHEDKETGPDWITITERDIWQIKDVRGE